MSNFFLFSWPFQSEERGQEAKEQSLRAAGSSPCVVVGNNSFNLRDSVADPEQGIYHGFYRLGSWICIADRDVWRRQDDLLGAYDTFSSKNITFTLKSITQS